MAINALKKLELGQQLSELLKEQVTADALKKLDLATQISAILKELGFGSNQSGANQSDVPELVPELVGDFLSGKFNSQDMGDYIITLNSISEYVGQHLTLEEVKAQAAIWIDGHMPSAGQGAS